MKITIDNNTNAPKPYTDFNPGDILYTTIHNGITDVYGLVVDPNNNGGRALINLATACGATRPGNLLYTKVGTMKFDPKG